ncbi:thiamine diphosphate-binding protein [Haematococcus lacustris]
MAPPAEPQPSFGALPLLRTLSNAGCRICFANPGTTEMWMVAALDAIGSDASKGGMRAVLGLHENVCTGAADGFARMQRGSPPLVLLHLGPGLGNGLANLHNAHRARSPMVVMVGDMVRGWVVWTAMQPWGKGGGACGQGPLVYTHQGGVQLGGSCAAHGQGAEGGAGPQPGSHQTPCQPAAATAVGAAPEPLWQVVPGVTHSRVVTLVVPHDLTWQAAEGDPEPFAATAGSQETEQHQQQQQQGGSAYPPSEATPGPTAYCSSRGRGPQGLAEGEQGEGEGEGEGEGVEGVQLLPGMVEFVEACAAALKQCDRGKAVLYLAGEAALQAGGALHAAGLVAAATGASLMCENAFARVDRGAGLPVLTRLPYFPQESEQALSKFDMVVVVDAKLPVASFGYRDGPSQLLPASMIQRDAVWELDQPPGAPPGTVAAALKLLARQVAPAHDIIPGRNCGGVFAPPTPSRPPLPPAGTRLSPPVLCTVVAALQPPDCILVDESLTSGGAYWDLSKGCPTFTHMTLTGGAIGSGPPMALGAALACPGRRVINLQADGSAMYSVQVGVSTHWDCAASRTVFHVLQVECARQRLPTPGAATRSLTDLGHPAIDWVALAAGMGVPGVRVSTAGELETAMRKSLDSKGPMLIQAML